VQSDKKGGREGERKIPALSLLTKAKPLHSKSKGQNGESPREERVRERQRASVTEREPRRRRSEGAREERERERSTFCTSPLKQPAGEVMVSPYKPGFSEKRANVSECQA
jgi:hypothetical protein